MNIHNRAMRDDSTERAGPPVFGQDPRKDLPKKIGRFEILDVLGVSQGIVYKARQSPPERIVALKLPRDGRLLTREDRERFLAEIQTAAQLDHSAIVPVLDAGEIDGAPYYTMPFIEGRDLYAEIAAENLDWQGRWSLFAKLCRAVQSLHEHRLVHRDLKPSNILVDRHGDIRLLDFGLAQAAAAAATKAGPRLVAGTPQYMAPEQTLGDNRLITPACDVYALGMILHYLATDALPYVLKPPVEAAIETLRKARITRVDAGRLICPPSLRPVIVSALSHDPERRPRTAGRLLAAAERALAGSSAPETTPASVPIQAPPDEGTERTQHTRRALALVLVGFGIITLALALWALRVDSPIGRELSPPSVKHPHNEGQGPSAKTTIQKVVTETRLLPPPNGDLLPGVVHWRVRPGEEAAIRSRVQEALLREFDHRNHGAILVRSSSRGNLSLLLKDLVVFEASLGKGEALVLFTEPGADYKIQHFAPSGPLEQKVSVELGLISTIDL